LSAKAHEFLRLLHPHAEDSHYLAVFKPDTHTELIPADDSAKVSDFLERHNFQDVYVGVSARDRVDRGADGCTRLHALFAEVDTKDFSSDEEARAKVGAFPLPPSFKFASGGGYHCYWLLTEPIDIRQAGVEKVTEYLRALAFRLSADKKSAEPARVLRVPGTTNTKYSPARSVDVLVWEPARRYDLISLLAECPPEAGTTGNPRVISPALPQRLEQGARNDTLFREACRLRRLGLDEAEILPALKAINLRRCKPPVDEEELGRIAKSAGRYEPAEDAFPSTESGDSEFFAACNGEVVRYDHRRGRWLIFDGLRWAGQTDGQVERLGLEAMRARQRAAVGNTDRMKWAIGGESRKRRSNLLSLAQSVQPLSDAGDKWDAAPWLLGVRNGVVDLRTGELRAGRPEDRITLQCAVPFDPEAPCPQWDNALRDIFGRDEQLMAYFDRFAGYSITGDCREEALALCWGGGGNGKSTLLNTIAAILGDYADDLPFSALELHDRSGIPNDIAKLVGKRFVTSSESGEAKRLNEARVKALTGRDPITARFLRQEFFTFSPVAKFWLATNFRPVVRDNSVGFWRRMHLIPFTQSFEEKPDKKLKDRLRDEGTGILARLVRGCLAWQREGLGAPTAVTEATRAYRSDSSPLARFLEERCLLQASASATAGELYEAYQRWCNCNQERSRLNRRQFWDVLGHKFTKDESKPQRVTYVGIGLIREHDDAVL
jgi:P4 family phage/plasmid primase-like protien